MEQQEARTEHAATIDLTADDDVPVAPRRCGAERPSGRWRSGAACGNAAHAAAPPFGELRIGLELAPTSPLRRLRNRNQRGRPHVAPPLEAALRGLTPRMPPLPALGELRLGLEPARPRLRVVFRIGSGVRGAPSISRVWPAARQAPPRSGRASTIGAARAASRNRGRPRRRTKSCTP